MNQIKILLEESSKEKPDELLPWMERRLERAISAEERNFIMMEHIKPKLSKIFLEESRYLNDEEITHRLSMESLGMLEIPCLLKLEHAWAEQERNLTNEEAISKFLDTHLQC